MSMTDIYTSLRSEFGNAGVAIFMFINCTGLPTLTAGFGLMVWSTKTSANARVLAFENTKVEAAIINRT